MVTIRFLRTPVLSEALPFLVIIIVHPSSCPVIMTLDAEMIIAFHSKFGEAVAGLKKLREMGVVDKSERVVCICTGNGLKDPDTIIDNCAPPVPCGNSVEDVERILSQ